jgi:hypothetical protein
MLFIHYMKSSLYLNNIGITLNKHFLIDVNDWKDHKFF